MLPENKIPKFASSVKEVEYRALSWIPEYRIGSDGSVYRVFKGEWRLLKQIKRPVYLGIGVMTGDKGSRRCKACYVHRLVAEAYHGPCPIPRYEVCHNNGNRYDNSAENLRWDSPSVIYVGRSGFFSITSADGERLHGASLPAWIKRVTRDGNRYRAWLIGAPWGNPYRPGVDGDAIAKYEARLLADKYLMGKIHQLEGLSLACWCAPNPCHAQVLWRYANEIPEPVKPNQMSGTLFEGAK